MATHSPVGTFLAERSRSQPRIPVPIEAKRILRPPAGAWAASAVGSRTVAFTAAPAATTPAPNRTKSLRVIDDAFIVSLPVRPPFSLYGPIRVHALIGMSRRPFLRRIFNANAKKSLNLRALSAPHPAESWENEWVNIMTNDNLEEALPTPENTPEPEPRDRRRANFRTDRRCCRRARARRTGC